MSEPVVDAGPGEIVGPAEILGPAEIVSDRRVPLRRKPTGPVTRRINHRQRRRSKVIEAYVAVSGFAVVSSVF